MMTPSLLSRASRIPCPGGTVVMKSIYRSFLQRADGKSPRCLLSAGLHRAAKMFENSGNGRVNLNPPSSLSKHLFSTLTANPRVIRPVKERRVGIVTEMIYRDPKQTSDYCVARVAGLPGAPSFEVVGQMPGLKKGGKYEFSGDWKRSDYGKMQLHVDRIMPHVPCQRRGIVTEMIYRDQTSDYCVARVAGLPGAPSFEVVGQMPGLKKGGRYEFSGYWERSKYDKIQLQADRIMPHVPCQQECLKAFLAESVPNVGSSLAGRIVECFGEKTLGVISGNKKTKGKLDDVRGISKTGAQKIVEHCRDNRGLLDVYMRLAPFGVRLKQCDRIVLKYRGQALKVIESNPYDLCHLKGLNFQHVDAIALNNSHIAPDCSVRIDQGAAHVLRQASKKGHTAQAINVLLDDISKLLELNRAAVESKIRGDDLPSIEHSPFPGPEYAQLKTLAECERIISDFFKPSRRKQPGLDEEKLKAAAKLCGDEEFEFADCQKEAINSVAIHGNAIITGGPGCGKSAVIAGLLCAMPTVPTEIVAPTGRAAQRLKESIKIVESNVRLENPLWRAPEPKTIHRLVRSHGIQSDCKLVIVDEASMLDTELAAELVGALPEGCGLVLVGDPDQLPSIGPGQVLQDMIRSGVVPVTKLERVYRQEADSSIVDLAYHVNQGKFEKDFVDGLLKREDNQVQFVQLDADQSVPNALADIMSHLPGQYGPTDIQILAPMKTQGDHGTAEINNHFHGQHGNATSQSEFKVGEKVIQTRNNYDLKIFNGTVGIVEKVMPCRNEEGEYILTVNFDGTTVKVEGDDLEDLDYAYAITIHKSQGSEYPVVIVVLSRKHRFMLERRLFYTAITRPKERLIIVGEYEACVVAAQKPGVDRCCLLLESLRR